MHFYSPPGLGEPRAWKNRGVGTDFFSDTPWSHLLGLMVYYITAFKICCLETYLTLSPRMRTTSWHTTLIWVFEHKYLPFSLLCKKVFLSGVISGTVTSSLALFLGLCKQLSPTPSWRQTVIPTLYLIPENSRLLTCWSFCQAEQLPVPIKQEPSGC